MPTSEEQVRVRLRAMLRGQNVELGIEPIVALWAEPSKLSEQLQAAGLEAYTEHIVSHVVRDTETYTEYQAFAARLGSVAASQRDRLDRALRDLLWKWFHSKLVVLEDYAVTGNQIINRICEETPPGFHNRIMGLQNIKGPGLDFVYRWQAWDTCQKAVSQLHTPDPLVAEQGLRTLVAFRNTAYCVKSTSKRRSK